MPVDEATSAGPLSRFTVLDLSHARAGPTAVRQLADWGANVIRIEAPADAESYGGFFTSRDNSDFQNLHRNKRCITLNLKEPAGKQVFLEMVKKADVVVENYRPQVKHRLGVDYETLSRINPRIVCGSISGFGQKGRYADRAGVDQIAQGMGGLMSVTGVPGQGPMRVGIAIADLTSGIFLAQGILIALLEREVSGKGQWVHTSLLEATISMLDFQAARWLIDGEVPKPAGNEHPKYVPSGIFPTSDGFVNLSATSPKMWKNFCDVVAPELHADPDFKDDKLRTKNRDRLAAEISERTRRRPTAEWVEALNAVGVPSGPVYTIDQTFADPQVEELGMAAPVQHPTRGELRLVGQPVTLSRASKRIRRATADPGEHTVEVLREFGIDQALIDGVRQRASA